MTVLPKDYHLYHLLRLSPFQRRPDGWRFGTKRIGDGVVDRLIATGRAATDGKTVWLVEAKPAP